MPLKTLNLTADLRETIAYDAQSLPLMVCDDSFDDYVAREWSCHWHDEFEFLLVKQGSIRCTIYEGPGNPSSFDAHAGEAVFISSGVLHSVKAMEPGTICSGFVLPLNFFDFRPLQNISSRILQPLSESGLKHIHARPCDQRCANLITSIAELCALPKEYPYYEIRCIELVCKIWRQLNEYAVAAQRNAGSARHTLAEARVKQMISYMHAHFHEHVSADDLARHAGISRTECFKSFAQVVNTTPVNYLNEYRLTTAAMLLSRSDRSIAEIASACGFSDASYFSRLFRKMYGLTPKQYRSRT